MNADTPVGDPFNRFRIMSQLTPLPDVRELSPESGWLMWDLAERLNDAERARTAHTTSTEKP